MEYNTSVWNPFQLTDIKVLERVQRSFTARIPGLWYVPYEERLKRLGLESLEQRRLINDIQLMYKIVKNKIQIRFEDFFAYQGDTFTRKHCLAVIEPPGHINAIKYSFVNRMTKIWNRLPEDLVTEASISSFKRHLNKSIEQNEINITELLKFCKPQRG